jgi:hypothetical protein
MVSNASQWTARRGRTGAVLLAAAGLAIVACQVVAGIAPVEKQQRGVGSDGGPTADGGTPDPCRHLVPPNLPETDDGQTEEVPPFVLALHTVKFIPTGADRYQGFDLDGTCTCDKRPNTAHNGEPSCAPKKDACDADGGVDNAAAGLFETFAPTGFSPDKGANDALDAGGPNLLLVISKYNGKANDREVNVGAMVTNGILDGSGCGTTVNSVSGRAPPGWCGRDRWTYPQQYAKPSGSKEPLFVGKGYVNNNELVFNAPIGELKMFFSGSIITFGSPISAGHLSKSNGQWKLDGLLTGRIPLNELLRAVGGVNVDGAPLCKSQYFPLAVQPELCKRADIGTTFNFDFVPKGVCDAISTVLLFTADEAQIGEELTEPDPPNGCDSVDPSLFQCP